MFSLGCHLPQALRPRKLLFWHCSIFLATRLDFNQLVVYAAKRDLNLRCVQDPRTYSRPPDDWPLLAIPTSCGRVADHNLNWGEISGICLPLPACLPLFFAIVGCV